MEMRAVIECLNARMFKARKWTNDLGEADSTIDHRGHLGILPFNDCAHFAISVICDISPLRRLATGFSSYERS